jgi:hypothetical protein
MALLVPQITYPASAPANTLVFTYPPVEKPFGLTNDGDEIESVRNDSITLSGLRQSMFFRQDEFKHLIMQNVPQADMPAWKLFFNFAQTGDSFLYYPDSTLSGFDEWLLEDSGGSNRSQTSSSSSSSSTNWNPKYVQRHLASFELVMRKVPGGLSSV